jgi:hypothetical protein
MVKEMKVIPKIKRMLVKTLLMMKGRKPVPRRTLLKKVTSVGTGFLLVITCQTSIA